MKLSELKKGFWGYQKESVYHYIALLEEEASERLMEKDAQAAREKERAEKRIRELEASVKRLRRENDALRRKQKKSPDTWDEPKEQRHQRESHGNPTEGRNKNTWYRGNTRYRQKFRNKDNNRKQEDIVGKENRQTQNRIQEEATDTGRGDCV